MVKNSQIEKIEELTPEAVTDLLVNVLKKRDFQDIEAREDCVFARQKGLLNTSSAVFITFPFKMGGTGEIDAASISKKIKDVRESYAANNVFVYSNQTITKGFQSTIDRELSSISITYIGRDDLIKLVDEVFPEYWRHDDLRLIQYEKAYTSFVANDSDLKKLKFPNDKYAKLLDFFIEPGLVRYYQDAKTNNPISKRYTVNELIAHNESLIIEGEAGSGKSTLLKKIGVKLIDENTTKIEKKHLPIYLTSLEIFYAENVANAIREKLAPTYESPLSELAKEYDIHLLIDSIDELSEKQSDILNELNDLSEKYGLKYYIASRNGDNLVSLAPARVSSFSIRKFNLTQIKLFLEKFFSGDLAKSSTLLDALRDNQMLERLPITPLTLSLISILFEETEFEIPATISDIYDNFNTLIIGKAVVSSKVEFVDISFKERILSIYALKLLETPGHIPMTRDEFIDYFKKYFEGKSLPIKKGSLEEVLDYLIQNTGILFLKDGNQVQFTHDSYMEYYAALEIFKHRRDYEDKLVENFYDPNWQNASVFYAGESKDMPEFLKKIKEKMMNTANINDSMSGIFGSGYLLQALYQTDNMLRKEVIIEALRLSLQNFHLFGMMAADDVKLFQNYKLPILTLINFVYFYESFNSITLAEPLRMSFADKYLEFENKGKKDMGIGYNLVELAFTLDSKRICDQTALQKVIDTPELLRDPNLNILASISLDMLGKDRYKEFRSELKKVSRTLGDIPKKLIEQPMSKLRFSVLDTIQRPTKVKLLVEGKTDAMVLEYAYMSLTEGDLPYWSINKAGKNEEIGSAEEVRRTLEQSYAIWKSDPESIIIGIFDHDAAGLKAYGSLDKFSFVEIEQNKLKKHKDGNIYGLCIPIPGEMEVYLQDKQEFNFFELEHYMGLEYLKDILKETPIPEVYEIKGDKMALAQRIRKETSPKAFSMFTLLLQEIDKIAEMQINYQE